MSSNYEKSSIIQTITGSSVVECKEKLNRQYGLNWESDGHKTVLKGGFLGLWQKEVIEFKYHLTTQPKVFENPTYRGFSSQNDQGFSGGFESAKNNSSEQRALDISIIKKELNDNFKDFKQELRDQLSDIYQAPSSQIEHKNIQRIRELLEENDFTPSYIKKITDRIKTMFSLDDLEDFELMQEKVINWIGDDIQIAPEISPRPPKVIIVIGPTGVGKTTTIARFAASVLKSSEKTSGVQHRPTFRMITIDSMRVGALEQLRNWSEIMKNTLDKAESAEDLMMLYNTYRDNTDYIFVDSGGYSPNDFDNITRMRKIFDIKGMHPNFYLAITAGTKARDIENIIRNYETFDFKSVIITKCDETSTFGGIVSVLSEKGKKISWITDGQNVMHSLQKANPLYFLRKLQGFRLDIDALKSKYEKIEDDLSPVL